jgi:transposase
VTRALRPTAALPRIYLYREPVDFRKSFRGLAAIVEQELGHNDPAHQQWTLT